jgi:uncharacterized protein YtpQ (UPF0354 family)
LPDLLRRITFTEAVAAAARSAIPSANVAVVGDLELEIHYGVGRETGSLFLGNAYDLYLDDPQHLKEMIRIYVEAVSPPLPNAKTTTVDRSRIIPVVKNREWVDYVQRLYRAEGKELQYSEGPFTGELMVVYAEDNSAITRFLSTGDDVGDRARLHDLALANLIRLLPKIEMRAGADNTWLISAGGDYEASLLLLGDLWSGGQIKVDGDIVVAVPAKDALLVTGSRNGAGIALLRKFAAEVVNGAYALTAALFVYRGGKFVTFEGQ